MAEPTYEFHTNCPHCSATQPLHTNATGHRPPHDGDIAICWRCRGIAVFATGPFGLLRRMPTPEEQRQIVSDPRLGKVLGASADAWTPSQAAALSRRDGHAE